MFKFLGQAFIPVFILISMITESEILIIISSVLLILLLAVLVGIVLYLVLQNFIEQIATVKSWSYTWDNKYYAYSIQANKSLLGVDWSTSEYLSGSEEEAKRLTDLKNQYI